MSKADWFSLLQALAIAALTWFTAKVNKKVATVNTKADETHALLHGQNVASAVTSENVSEIKKELIPPSNS